MRIGAQILEQRVAWRRGRVDADGPSIDGADESRRTEELRGPRPPGGVQRTQVERVALDQEVRGGRRDLGIDRAADLRGTGPDPDALLDGDLARVERIISVVVSHGNRWFCLCIYNETSL